VSPLALLAALLPVTAVGLLLGATPWDRRHTPAPIALVAALAVGLGIGAGSVTFFLALVACNGARAGVLTLDCALLLGAGALWWRSARTTRRGRPAARGPRPACDRVLASSRSLDPCTLIPFLGCPVSLWYLWG
jgi:hypothetical protein